MAKLIPCPTCESPLSLGAEHDGRRVRCPRCKQMLEMGNGQVWTVSTPAPTPAPPAPRYEPPPQPAYAPPDDESEAEPAPRRRRRRVRRWAAPRDPGMSGGELTLFGLLFLVVPGANVILSSVLYYVWKYDQPRRAGQVNMLGFSIFGCHALIGIVLLVLNFALPTLFGDRLKEFTSTEGGFKVRAPGQPNDRRDITNQRRLTMLLWGDPDKGHYSVSFTDPWNAGISSEAEFEQIIDQVSRNASSLGNANITRNERIKLANQYPGRMIEGTFTDSRTSKVEKIRFRAYLANRRVYVVMADGPPAFTDTAESTAFLDSFELLR